MVYFALMNPWTTINRSLPQEIGLRRACMVALMTVGGMLGFALWPASVEWLFLRSLFQVWRVCYDFTLGLLPIPSGVWFMLTGTCLVYRSWRKRSWSWRGIRQGVLWGFSAFFWLWGYLYFLPPTQPEEQAHWNQEDVYHWLMEVQVDLETHLAVADQSLSESDVRDRLERVLSERNWPTVGRVRARAWYDGGASRYWGVSGIYLPWCMEGHLSATLPPEVLPFVRAHEMAHGYGIAREGEADYYAYKALTTRMRSDTDAAAHWKAQYELWSSLRRVLVQLDSAVFERAHQQCSPALLERHRMVKSNYSLYDGHLEHWGAQSNAIYLKTMGMSDGLANYDRWVTMLWRERQQNKP